MKLASKACVLLLFLIGATCRAQDGAREAPGGGLRISLELTGRSDDGPRIAYTLSRTVLSQQQWEQRVEDFLGKYQTWEKDTGGDMGRYLNDRLIIVALSAAGGEIEKIQGGMAFLALYWQFGQQAPSVVTKFLAEHRNSASRLLKDFTWEKASDYVKNKRWREDIAERRRLANQAAAAQPPPPAGAGPAQRASPTCLGLLALDWSDVMVAGAGLNELNGK
jgi:hypothetical protein